GFDSGVTSPGTDYSQQAAAQVAYTDLVIGGAGNTNKLTSAAHPFNSTSPGNVINIKGGTGFSQRLYRIRSVSGSTATMDGAGGISWENFVFDGNSQTSSNGFYLTPISVFFLSFLNCIFKRFTGEFCIRPAGACAINIQSCEFADNAFTTNESSCVLGRVGAGA